MHFISFIYIINDKEPCQLLANDKSGARKDDVAFPNLAP